MVAQGRMSSELSSNYTLSSDPWGRRHEDPGQTFPAVPPLQRDDSVVAAIAPWLAPEEPEPSPIPPPRRPFAFSSVSLNARRQGSQANLRTRGDSDASLTDQPVSLDSNPHKEGKRSFFNFIKKKASRPAFTHDDVDRFGTQTTSSFGGGSISESFSNRSFMGSVTHIPQGSTSNVPSTSSRRFRKPSRNKVSQPEEPLLSLDTDLDDMEGIVDTARVTGTMVNSGEPPARSPWDPPSRFDSANYGSSPFAGPSTSAGIGTATFSNIDPFRSTSLSPRNDKGRAPPPLHLASVSPKSIQSSDALFHPYSPPLPPPKTSLPSPNWVAPESWATIPREGGKDRYVSSDDEDLGEAISQEYPSVSNPSEPVSFPPPLPGIITSRSSNRPSSSRKGREKSLPLPPPPSAGLEPLTFRKPAQCSIRIYRADGKYHVVNCPPQTSVQDMRQALTKRLGIRGDTHRLYLRERGRERALGAREAPGMILRRRLEQAGYEPSDDLDSMGGEDLSFLLRFVFRNARLGTIEADDETFTTDFEHIELAERGLETVPALLHQHASSIITLNLSKNPLVDIPLDFVQDCSSLRELRLSHVAMKRIPHTIRHIKSLQWLDISCNRIIELDHAGLEEIPVLRQVFAQNNRISNLPHSFARMTSLKFLNISNNKFEAIPLVICDIPNLVDLDVSFNSISGLPAEMGRLKSLERFIVVGNHVQTFPEECQFMTCLRELDCRRNQISDLSLMLNLPRLESLYADHNNIHVLDFSVGPKLVTLAVSHNPVTKFHVQISNPDEEHYALTTLDMSHMKLSALEDDGAAFASFKSLTSLKLDYNKFHSLPDVVCSLSNLEYLSCTNNDLHTFPEQIGQLQKLRALSAHNNNIKIVPESIWECGSLIELNISSNVLDLWKDPVMLPASYLQPSSTVASSPDQEKSPMEIDSERKGSAAGLSFTSRTVPPLANSLQRLILADNRLGVQTRTGFDIFRPLAMMRELRVLNLSFNDINELPPLPQQTFAQLQELYLSGNNLTSLPGEEMQKLSKLKVLYLNGNKLQTLPAELRRVTGLEILDVGNNLLKYNIANWQYDWNWNFNFELRYLNLSGNKRLEIGNHQQQSLTSGGGVTSSTTPKLFDFANLNKLRVLGLMDVTLVVPSIPDDSVDRRVRTSDTEINGMAYGIADTLGKVDGPTTFDLVLRNFRGKENESLFGMFGRALPNASSNRAAKFLHENFPRSLTDALAKIFERVGPTPSEDVLDAMRSTFLSLNRRLYDHLITKIHSESTASGRKSSTISASGPVEHDLKSGANAIVVYIVDRPQLKTMYVANVGNMLAVVSKSTGDWNQVSVKHDPFERSEIVRIRAAEGWVSPKGMVNDEEDLSRSFGLYHLLPAVNARPDVLAYNLSEEDELVIIGNRGLWDFVSLRTAVDIARMNRNDPMKAAQMLRDYAMSYGADGNTVIMVIAVADLFGSTSRSRLPPADAAAYDPMGYLLPARRGAPRLERDRLLTILDEEIQPPRGHLALVFTDIRNSTTLWEKNAGMALAMKVHNELLRRQLRLIGGYEVKTEGDSFMVSFQTVPAALLWCFVVQTELLKGDWPLEILESEEGAELFDREGRMIARGLSVRMGIHWGKPVCADDPLTSRMDYFGPMVNRSARIMAQAQGGQIMVSSDVVRQISKMDEIVLEGLEGSASAGHVDALKKMGIEIREVGERSLKGLEVPEMLSLVFPHDLIGRLELKTAFSPATGTRVQFSAEQIKQLALLTIRLETLASSRVFRSIPQRKSLPAGTIDPLSLPNDSNSSVMMYANPDLLMPNIKPEASDQELLLLLDMLSGRIENALSMLRMKQMTRFSNTIGTLEHTVSLDQAALMNALRVFKDMILDVA